MSDFKGFDQRGFQFLTKLERNNDREWFKEHRGDYEQYVLDPARAFVVTMGERLEAVAPGIHAIPQVDKSIFRIHRDTRFSKDKRPFKTHFALFLWLGDAPKMESPGFYVHFEKDSFMVGGGMHSFTKEQLVRYREAVDAPKKAETLEAILKTGRKHFKDNNIPGMEDYKRVPRGFPQDHPSAHLLKKKGVVFGEEGPIPASLFTGKAVEYVFKRFEKMVPLNEWLLENVARNK